MIKSNESKVGLIKYLMCWYFARDLSDNLALINKDGIFLNFSSLVIPGQISVSKKIATLGLK